MVVKTIISYHLSFKETLVLIKISQVLWQRAALSVKTATGLVFVKTYTLL